MFVPYSFLSTYCQSEGFARTGYLIPVCGACGRLAVLLWGVVILCGCSGGVVVVTRSFHAHLEVQQMAVAAVWGGIWMQLEGV